MAALTYQQLLTEFNVWLQDSEDISFESSEKESFLSTAIRDQNVFDIARDASLTSSSSTYSYTLPTGFSSQLSRVGLDLGTNEVRWIDRNSWYVTGSTLYFENRLVDAKPIVIEGKKKLTDSDTFDDILQNYILHLAMVEAFRLIQSQLATRFYKNDITMGEVSSVIAQHEQAAARLRSGLENRIIVEV